MPKVIHTKFNLVLRRLFQREPLGLYSYLKRFKGRRSSTFKHYITYYRNWRILGTAATLSLLTLFTLFLAPLYYKDPSTIATVGTANLATTSLELITSGQNTASATVNITSDNGTFANSITNGTEAGFKVTSNNFTGYTLKLAPAAGNDNTLASTSGSFTTITGDVTATNFSQDNTTGAGLNGKWGIGYRDSSTSTYDTYHPASSTLTIGSTSSANSTTSTYDTYYIGLGVRAGYTQAAGTYNNSTSNNTYVLTATGNAIPLKIIFMRNDGTSNVFYTQNESTSTTSTTLYATKPTRDHYSFINWCFGTVTTTNGVDSCTGTTYAPGATFSIDQTVSNQNITMQAMWKIDTFTCTKRYRLQGADGNFPTTYTADGSETVNYGGSCSYSKAMTDYKANGGANGSTASTSVSNISENKTLSLDLYRNTYTLTVNAGTNTSGASGSGTYRWGQGVAVSVTKAANVTCISYTTPVWKVTSGSTGSFSSTSGTSVTYTMPKGNSAIAANSTASNVAQTITFKTSNASGITLNGNYKTNNQTLSINCGTYNISGSYPDNYEFSSWSATAGSFGNSAAAATTYKVVGKATITLTGKQSKIYMWNATGANCGTTMYDNRDGTERAYTTKLINGLCWMTTNLALGKSTATELTSATSNVPSSGYTLPASSTSGFSDDNSQNIYNADAKTCTSNKTTGACYGYYTYAAATAGINPSSAGDNAVYDICPSGWRLPTWGELNRLVSLISDWSAVYSGYYYYSAFYDGGSRGYYWSSTSGGANTAYHLMFVNGTTTGARGKNYGQSIRCVAKS